MNVPVILRRRRFQYGGGVVPFSPSTLFASGEEGAWYEPSTTTAFKSTTDLTPCGYGDACGFLLDKSQGAGYSDGSFTGLGSELVTNGTFDTDVSGWTDVTANISHSTDEALVTSAGSFGYVRQFVTTVTGKIYAVNCIARVGTTNNAILSVAGSPVQQTGSATNVTLSGVFVASSTSTEIRLQVANAGTAYFDNISVRELPGNHATQATSSARPILARVPEGGRRNLLDDTENFVPATSSWAATNINSTSPTVIADQDGEADQVTFGVIDGTGDLSILRIPVESLTTAGPTYTISIDLKAGDASEIGKTIFFYQNDGTGILTYAAHTLTSDYVRVSVTGAWASTSRFISLATNGGAYFGNEGALTDSNAVALVRSVQLEAASSATAYQKVVDQYDITEAGVTSLDYLAFDGANDGMATASIDFTGTDKMSVFAGVLSNTAPGTNVSNILAELSASSGSNNGSFGIFAPIDNGGFEREEYGALLRGSLNDIAAYNETINEAHVISALFDIGAATNASQIVFRSDGSAVAPTLSATDAGTGNFGNYPFNIGARNNAASAWFDGKLFSLIVRGAASTAGEISDTESYVANLSGVTI